MDKQRLLSIFPEAKAHFIANRIPLTWPRILQTTLPTSPIVDHFRCWKFSVLYLGIIQRLNVKDRKTQSSVELIMTFKWKWEKFTVSFRTRGLKNGGSNFSTICVSRKGQDSVLIIVWRRSPVRLLRCGKMQIKPKQMKRSDDATSSYWLFSHSWSQLGDETWQRWELENRIYT